MFHRNWTMSLIVVGLSFVRFIPEPQKSISGTRGRRPRLSVYGCLRRYFITKFRSSICRWSRRVYGRIGARVYRISKHTLLKYGDGPEPETMLFVQRHTSIPVPKIYDYWPIPGGVIMLMERIDARTLEAAWSDLSRIERLRIFSQLKRCVEQLRSLEQPPEINNVIGTFDGQPISDALLSSKLCGPFKSDAEFNEFMVSRFAFLNESDAGRVELEELKALIARSPRRRIVFTHSDIMPRNILINSNNDLASLLDWEMAGWMPEQWEYLKSMWMGQYDLEWPDYVPSFLEAYDEDLKLHTRMREMHGAPY